MTKLSNLLLGLSSLLFFAACGEGGNTNANPAKPDTIAMVPEPPSTPQPPSPPSAPYPVRDKADTIDREQRIPGDFKGNYIWSATMNLAWRDMMDNVLHGPAKLGVKGAKAKEMVRKLNESQFSKLDLDSKSYYVKSGFGQETIETINQEVAEKFPKGKIPPLIAELKPTFFINYALYLKQMKYPLPFETLDMKFQGKPVQGFGGGVEADYENLRIVNYESKDKFILFLSVRDNDDHIFLLKGFSMDSPKNALSAIAKSDLKKMTRLTEVDSFKAPILHCKYEHDYFELMNALFQNKGFKDHEIALMKETIDFEMDQYGARVRSISEIIGADSAGVLPPEPKSFLLDKPYWVVMKRSDSPRPYFILGVRNTEMMKAATN